MLVKVTDKKGETIWINPLFVRMVKQKKNLRDTEIFFHVDPMRVATPYLTVIEPAEQVAEAIGVTLPLLFGAGAATADFVASASMFTSTAMGSTDSGGDGGDGGGD